MASGTRNRVLGMAVLVGAIVSIVLIVLLSEGSGHVREPQRDETRKQSLRGEQGDEVIDGIGSLVGPDLHGLTLPRSENARLAQARKRRSKGSGERTPAVDERVGTGGSRGVPRRSRAKRRSRSPAGRGGTPQAPHSPRLPSQPSPPQPPPASAPAALVPPPAQDEPPKSDEQPAQPDIPKSPAKQPGKPEPSAVEITIRDGKLEAAPDRIRAQDGRVLLRIRSDQLLVFEVEDRDLTRTILPGGDALVEFDARSGKAFEPELRRRKGALVLRLDD